MRKNDRSSPWGRARKGLFLIPLLLIVSCSTISKPQYPGDTLLVIPVFFNMKPGTQWWGYYYSLEFEGLPKPVVVSPTTNHYVAISGLPAGRYAWKKISLLPLGSGYSRATAQSYDAPNVVVETREFTATMAPFLIESIMEEVLPRRFQQKFNIKPVQDTDRKVILEELNKQEGFAAWKNGLEN